MYGMSNGTIPVTFSEHEGHFCCLKLTSSNNSGCVAHSDYSMFLHQLGNARGV